jgi:uncharacterized protein DUF6894
MARYYFDVREGALFTEDLDGTELAGRHAVFAQARRLLLDIARETHSELDPFAIEISVREGEGAPMHRHSLLMEASLPDERAVKPGHGTPVL